VLGRDGVLSQLGQTSSAGAQRHRGATRRDGQPSMLGTIGARPIAGGFGGGVMQVSRPRDLGPLAFVVGLFLVLFAVTLIVGAPLR
jgi:hypothetical protein